MSAGTRTEGAGSYRDRLLGFLYQRAPRRPTADIGVKSGDRPTIDLGEETGAFRFARELSAVGGEVHEARAGESAPEAIVRVFAESSGSLERGALLARDADPYWMSPTGDDGFAKSLEALGIELVDVDGSTAAGELARLQFGLTVADAALAETGTIVQLARSFRPRSLSLLPFHHIVVLPSERIYETFDEFLAVQEERSRSESARSAPEERYFTWITGPSRTADIEKVLTIGVHGPARLSVILLESA